MEDNEPEIKRLQELFKGRFTFEEAQSLISHHHGDCLAAANFVIDEEPQRVRDVIGTENESWQVIANNHNWNDLVRQGIIEKQERLFACGPCDNVWWRKVPSRKLVSRCVLCRIRYEAVPRQHEWGRAKYQCQFCGNIFIGFGQMGVASNLCYRCETACSPIAILPGRRIEGRRSRNVHSCLCHNCFNRADGPFVEATCVHPRSLDRRVVYASQQHISTGSTVDTFLTQDDLASQASDFEPTLSDIDE
ncbi:shiftless antiviral inhibitor of ribosomal frameshifting protein homolog isoform X1 [Mytilus californianus]|uniref:shiftless antiviral inhibitor of ribosomal frameshifting protein homolog isoform X1 n=1 Tax=Mytilus californianus TaxID=6549 RepID=UPI0022453940|nr:shiftless antiviral inhibitor of ribosomal frameshifting protein homolog isoform X1 [Mytilus californianus]